MIKSYSTWENILIKNNYSFVYEYKINRFYIDNSNVILKKRFLKIDKYIKLFKSLKAKKTK